MALWELRRDIGDRITLTYHWDASAGGKPPEQCGEIDQDGEHALVAWVFDQAAPGDRVTLTNGVIVVRLGAPAGGARA